MSQAIRQASSIIVLVLVVTNLAFSAYEQAYSTNWTRVDFGPYLAAVNRLKDQDPLYVYNKDMLYTTEQYVYPPLPALMLRPMAGMNINKASHIWTATNVVLLIAVGIVFCFAVKLNPLTDLGTLLLVSITAFRNYPTQMQINIGNIDIQILLCLVAAMLLSRLKRWKEAAVFISIAASIKTWAIGFTLYLVMMRKWKEAILSASLTVGATVAMFAVLGLDEFEIFAKVQRLYTYQPKLNSNSIIPMCRLYSGIPCLEHHKAEMLFPGAPTILPIVGVIASLAVIVTFITIAWRMQKTAQARQIPLAMSFCIMTCLLLNPLCHQYYYVYALPVIWSLIVYADSNKRLGRAIEEDWIGIAMWGGALVAYLLLSVQSPGTMDTSLSYPMAPLGYGTTIVAGLILWLTTAVALVAGQRTRTVEDSQSEAKKKENASETETKPGRSLDRDRQLTVS